MAYVQPSSNLILFAGVELDKDYRATAWFPNEIRQAAWFVNKHVYKSYIDFTYIRKYENVIQVPDLVTDLKEYNYLRFQNYRQTDQGNYAKTYYAFIDRREYVNEKCTNIYFTVDPIQTYMFDYSVGYCMVEREHALTDEPGDNLVPEPLETWDMLPQRQVNLTTFGLSQGGNSRVHQGVVIYFFPNIGEGLPSIDEGKGLFYAQNSGKYCGLTCVGLTFATNVLNRYDIPLGTTETINALTKAGCTIANVQSAPEYVITLGTETSLSALVGEAGSIENSFVDKYYLLTNIVDYERIVGKTGSDLNQVVPPPEIQKRNGFKYRDNSQTYTCRNKKLETYPYRFCQLSSYGGDNTKLRWEFFKTSGLATFKILINTANKLTATCFPQDYKGISLNDDIQLGYDNIPTANYTIDYYTRWMVENKTALAMGTTTSAVIALSKGLIAGASPYDFAQIGQAAGDVASAFTQVQKAKDSFDICQTGQTSSDISFWRNRIGFYATDYAITGEQAEVLDSYFDLYGYAQKKLKKPYISGATQFPREAWYYLKTNGCRIDVTVENGKYSIPADDEVRICQIYDNGITFWNVEHATVTIGDYSHSNKTIEG